MMRVLVTGGAGYIGSVLVPSLLAKGAKVTVVDSFMYGQASLLDCTENPNLKVIRGDVRNPDLMIPLIHENEWVIPLACLVGAPLCARDPVGAQTINFDAIKMILDNRKEGTKVIFPTTNSGYGIGEKGVHCTEETPLRPVSLYGRLKVEIEELLLKSGDTITLRLATVFGSAPRMRMDLLVNDFTYRAYKDRAVVLFESHFKRNYIHVRDVVRAFLHAMDNFETMKGEPYNVGLSDANLSKKELCEKIKEYIPEFQIIESEIGQDPDKRDYVVSNEKIEKTGFQPKYSLDHGIPELLRAYEVVKPNAYTNI